MCLLEKGTSFERKRTGYDITANHNDTYPRLRIIYENVTGRKGDIIDLLEKSLNSKTSTVRMKTDSEAW